MKFNFLDLIWYNNINFYIFILFMYSILYLYYKYYIKNLD